MKFSDAFEKAYNINYYSQGNMNQITLLTMYTYSLSLFNLLIKPNMATEKVL